MDNIIDSAINLAMEIHNGEIDSEGNRITDHLLRVMATGKNVEEKILGVLHHITSSENITPSILLKEGYPVAVTDALKILNRVNNETYGEYLDRISGNRLSKTIKIYDLADKLDIRTLRSLSQNRFYELRFHLAAYRHLLGLPIGKADDDRLYGKL